MNHKKGHSVSEGSSSTSGVAARSTQRKLGRRCCQGLGIAALSLLGGCAVEAGEEPVASEVDALYMTGAAWPNGTVRVCWSATSLARANFLTTEGPTVRRRANDEWPAAARVSFVGWLPCPADTRGMAVINLNDSGNANANVGFPGTTGSSTVNFGVTRSLFPTQDVPHEFGHVLGFAHEHQRPDFDLTRICPGGDDGTNIPGGNNLGTSADINSIMNYCSTFTSLSPIDRQGVVVAYGARVNRFATSTTGTTWSNSFSHSFADVNGDGRADLIGRSSTGNVEVALAAGSGFAASTPWTTWDTRYSFQFADVNRDGRADLIGRFGTDVQVALSTGTSFGISSRWTTWSTSYDLQLADVNGDGRADIIGRSGTDVQVGLSTGTSFGASTRWITWNAGFDASFVDLSGDGRADIVGRSGSVIRAGVSNGTSFLASSVWTSWSTQFDHRFADVNGDGKADIIGRSGDDVQVAPSTGGLFAGSTRWTRWDPAYDIRLADTNGDGRLDLLGRAGTDIQVALASN